MVFKNCAIVAFSYAAGTPAYAIALASLVKACYP